MYAYNNMCPVFGNIGNAVLHDIARRTHEQFLGQSGKGKQKNSSSPHGQSAKPSQTLSFGTQITEPLHFSSPGQEERRQETSSVPPGHSQIPLQMYLHGMQ